MEQHWRLNLLPCEDYFRLMASVSMKHLVPLLYNLSAGALAVEAVHDDRFCILIDRCISRLVVSLSLPQLHLILYPHPFIAPTDSILNLTAREIPTAH
jgi:hypothetical protein